MLTDESIRTDQTSLIMAFANENRDQLNNRRGFLYYCMQLAMGFKAIYKTVFDENLDGFLLDGLRSNSRYVSNELTYLEIKSLVDGTKTTPEVRRLLDEFKKHKDDHDEFKKHKDDHDVVAMQPPVANHHLDVDEIIAKMETEIGKICAVNKQNTEDALNTLIVPLERDKAMAEQKVATLETELAALQKRYDDTLKSHKSLIEAERETLSVLENESAYFGLLEVIGDKLDSVLHKLDINSASNSSTTDPSGRAMRAKSRNVAKTSKETEISEISKKIFESLTGSLKELNKTIGELGSNLSVDFAEIDKIRQQIKDECVHDDAFANLSDQAVTGAFKDELISCFNLLLDESTTNRTLSVVKKTLMEKNVNYADLQKTIDETKNHLQNATVKTRFEDFLPCFIGASSLESLEKTLKDVSGNLGKFNKGVTYNLKLAPLENEHINTTTYMFVLEGGTKSSEKTHTSDLVNFLVSKCILLRQCLEISSKWVASCDSDAKHEIFKTYWESMCKPLVSVTPNAQMDMVIAELQSTTQEDNCMDNVALYQLILAMQASSWGAGSNFQISSDIGDPMKSSEVASLFSKVIQYSKDSSSIQFDEGSDKEIMTNMGLVALFNASHTDDDDDDDD